MLQFHSTNSDISSCKNTIFVKLDVLIISSLGDTCVEVEFESLILDDSPKYFTIRAGIGFHSSILIEWEQIIICRNLELYVLPNKWNDM